jgi:hypothetical protein
MVTKGWCENCQFQNRNGVLYCSQCGEELQGGEELQSKHQPDPLIMGVAFAVLFAWLLFVGAWLFFYASGFSILQNIGIGFFSFAVMLILETVVLMPWAIRQSP